MTPPKKTTPPPPPPPPPPPVRATSPPPPNNKPMRATTEGRFSIIKGSKGHGERVLLYGKGKVGKTSLAALAPNPVFIDLEGGAANLDVPVVDGVNDWQDLRDLLGSEHLDDFDTIVIDSITMAQDWCVDVALSNMNADGKNSNYTNLEGPGFGKGQGYLYAEMQRLLIDIEHHSRQGRNVVLIAHECQQRVSDPGLTEDFTQYQPRLEKHSQGNIRALIVERVDHIFFVTKDIQTRKGKVIAGVNDRIIHLSGQPHFMAGSRTLEGFRPFEKGDGSIWKEIINAKA